MVLRHIHLFKWPGMPVTALLPKPTQFGWGITVKQARLPVKMAG
jgi:hypothetical protein